jgi:hypothetical protein
MPDAAKIGVASIIDEEHGHSSKNGHEEHVEERHE